MKKLTWLAVVALCLSGCAVKPPMGVLKASKADGSVTVGYLMNGTQPGGFTGEFTAAAKMKADKVCQGWGYKEAEDINEMTLQECTSTSMGVCVTGSQSRLYQCKG